MTLGLRRDVPPDTDLWRRIAARIDTPAERRFRQLPRDIEVTPALWPPIQARIRAHSRSGGAIARAGASLAHAVGVLAVIAITLLVTTQFETPTEEGVDTASAIEMPGWMASMLGRITGSAASPPLEGLAETARSIERDFLMVRSERLRIEQALSASADDSNLRTQWRHVYRAELRLIDEAQRLGNRYGTRSET